MHSVVRGPKATNKFWANWVVEDGHNFPIFPMPYVLKWGPASGGGRELRVAHGSQPHLIYSSGRRSIKAYITHPAAEFALGAREQASDYTLVSEGLFGLHAELRGTAGQRVLFPVYSGMAYVSGRYSGGFTPTVSHFHGLASVRKARDGVWTFRNRRGASFRVYVLNSTSGFVDGSYGFDHRGNLNKPLDGWVRIAHVLKDGDTQVLDAHAPAVVIGCKLELEAGGTVRYLFEKEGPRDVEILHFAYGHHARMMLQEQEPAAAQEQAPSASDRKNGPLLL